MKKLMSAVLMLFILTMLVAGASAAPDRHNNVRYTTSVNEYTNAYATSNSETGNAVVSTNAYLSAGYDKNVYANGYTQSIASGGTGTIADSGQAITGTISTGPINNGYTKTIASGGTVTIADSGQAITGTISTGPIN